MEIVPPLKPPVASIRILIVVVAANPMDMDFIFVSKCKGFGFFFGYCSSVGTNLTVLRLCRKYICTEYTLNSPMYPLRRGGYKNYEF